MPLSQATPTKDDGDSVLQEEGGVSSVDRQYLSVEGTVACE